MSNKAATKHRMSTRDTRKIRAALEDVLHAAQLAGFDELATQTTKALRATGTLTEMRRGGAENAAKFATSTTVGKLVASTLRFKVGKGAPRRNGTHGQGNDTPGRIRLLEQITMAL